MHSWQCATLRRLHPGPYRVMVYHTRSTEANNAYSLQRVLACPATGPARRFI